MQGDVTILTLLKCRNEAESVNVKKQYIIYISCRVSNNSVGQVDFDVYLAQ